MIQKPRKDTTKALKKSLDAMRDCLSQSVPGFDKKAMYGIKFSRIGTHYRIENAPVPPSDLIGKKLEKSFNSFMKQLKVNYDNVKVEGSCLIGTQKDNFLIGYENYQKTGKRMTKKIHGIEGTI